MITFTYPDEMKNGQLERLLVAIEEALENRNFGPYVTTVFRESIDQHGEQEIHRFLGSYLASWCEACVYDEPPDEEVYKRRAMKFLAKGYSDDLAVRELRDFQRNTARYHGRVVERCAFCGRLRHGMKWKKNKPVPESWIELEVTCPDCESQEDHHSPKPDPTEAEAKAWLAEGDTSAND